MTDRVNRHAVILGGFRTETLEESRAVSTFLDVLGLARSHAHANLWQGAGDSLHSRYERSAQWLDSAAHDAAALHILGYSMGCQLAVELAQRALDLGEDRVPIGSLTLVAPDPKYRPGRQDAVERCQGITSAYDEARALWSVSGSAGPTFVEALRRVAEACETGCRIVFCKEDGVAEWADNVEIMARALEGCSAIRWIETPVGEEVRDHGLRFRLDPTELSHIDCADEVHAALWYRLRFEPELSRP